MWPAPVDELLYVGRQTKAKLNAYDIWTIGGLAAAPDAYLKRRFGVVGTTLKSFALGLDETPIKPYDPERRNVGRSVKSYGSSLTAPHDI